MNKQEFVENLAERCDFSKAEAGRALDAILDSLTEAMADGEEVSFTGFGKFLSQRRRAREGVNPQDATKKIRIRAANVPKFRPGTALRAAAGSSSGDGPATSADGASAAPGSSGPVDSTDSRKREWKPLGER